MQTTAYVCNGGVPLVSCYGGEIACGSKCINPQTNATYCGAQDSCLGAEAGTTCAANEVCSNSACVCKAGWVKCGGTCIDPASNNTYCGASGSCTGGNAGATCSGGQACASSSCVTQQSIAILGSNGGSVAATGLAVAITTGSDTTNDTLTLTAGGGGPVRINVAGSDTLVLTCAVNTVTNVDASGITVGGLSWTAGALLGAATIKGAPNGTNTVTFSAAVNAPVTYVGGAGNDVITATNGRPNVVDLGGGTNSYVGNSGGHTVTGGNGNDTVVLTTGDNIVSLGNGINAFTATTGNNTYVGGTGVDTVTVGGGSNDITVGTGADVVTVTTAGSSSLVFTTIRDPHPGMQIAFTNLGTETFVSTKVSFADSVEATYSDYLDAVVSRVTQADHSMDGAFGWFQFRGNTYLVSVRHTTAGGINQYFVNGVDMVVKLQGLYDLSTATGGTTNILTLQ